MTMKKHKLLFLLYFSLMLIGKVSHSQIELVSRVVSTNGGVEVIRANGSREALQRRDEIRVGDKVVTADDGMVQLRFIDSAIVSLLCNSSLGIRAYQYESGSRDIVKLTLHGGGLRTIAGKSTNANYRLTIGTSVVRGSKTNFEVALGEDGTQYFGVYNGAISIEYAQGEAKLGYGEDSNFGRLSVGFPFEELSEQPLALGNSVMVVQNNSNIGRSTNCAS